MPWLYKKTKNILLIFSERWFFQSIQY